MAALAASAALVAACGTSGRELRAPTPGATAPPRSTSTTATTTAPPVVVELSVVSPAWEPGEDIPATFTCDDAGVSPPLSLGPAGDDAVELVVVVSEQTGDGHVHWVLAGLFAKGDEIAQGAVPPLAVQGLNSSGVPGWDPLCPPPGTTRTYDFTVYALDEPSGITAETPPGEALAQLEAGSVRRAAMTASYTRPA